MEGQKEKKVITDDTAEEAKTPSGQYGRRGDGGPGVRI